jgi:hypothetical protein
MRLSEGDTKAGEARPIPESKSVRRTDPSLVKSTKLVGDVESHLWALSERVDEALLDAPWILKLYPTALEGSAYFQSQYRPRPYGRNDVSEQPLELRQERSKANAARRASGRLRRYAVGNRLNRLGTLTYAVACSDPKRVSRDVGAFFRDLRREIGRPFPYVWVREWHPGGHGLHVHFLIGRYVPQSLLRAVWGRGIVDIRARAQVRLGEGAAAEARLAARYLSKYVSKAVQEDRIPGLHRYEVAQDFQPKALRLRWSSEAEAVLSACQRMGSVPGVQLRSDDHARWTGPSVVWMAWDR